ncbi:MAG: tRNA uridine-5-carboxymethylaminomethyl(34) synthesis GTPase MnmE [Legionellales bacterium]|nr:tRNA uridine-5-carboxymethylaminomethyl(34) synthesis GTPase MnmE [Legionellales bacterium]|tara:strand:+ start:56330 stop:57691 length:1362 start_codon:yes stop_codon:yes gene_type:complete
MNVTSDTITAQATPPGRGGVGIIRVSGPKAATIADAMLGALPAPRSAHYQAFKDADGSVIDMGLALYFPGPNSFTGEDVLELHGHGGPVVMDRLLQRVVSLGARIARPGEFSERAFLNDKIDLAQAEAIADLIDASSEQAARSAIRSLQGAFSAEIQRLVEAVIHLRMYVEAAIDFPDEEVDFLSDGKITSDLNQIITTLDGVLSQAKQGALLREGMTVVIAGKPNAGKSSLLNALSGRESAIVTDIPGTTRDLLREHILIDGIPLHIVDTAGLRESPDVVEQEGVKRAWAEIANADRVLLVVDAKDTTETDPDKLWPAYAEHDLPEKAVTVIQNKIDELGQTPAVFHEDKHVVIKLSVKTGAGLDELRHHLKHCVGAETAEGGFIARRRHLDALNRARELLIHGQDQFNSMEAGELLAEDLRQVQDALGEITGTFTPDDLLGRIFSSFCIGK